VTEDEAKAWLNDRLYVSRETWGRLELYVACLLEEMQHQNMIASSTRDHVWARHITDSAQLLLHAPENDGGVWLDLGSGPGLPGLIIAILSGWRVDMVESRRGRINFLCRMIEKLDLKQCSVHGCRLESLQFAGPSSVISARAFAPLDRLFEKAVRFSDPKTIWLLPKGRTCQNELDHIRPIWRGEFSVETSVTEPERTILASLSVRKRGKK